MRRYGSAIFSVFLFLAGTPALAVALDKVDARAIWSRPHAANTSRCEGSDNNAHRQLACVAGEMASRGASAEAVAFTRRLAALTGQVGYLSKLRSYGQLALATVEWPFMENTNAHSDSDDYIVNGTPRIVAGSTGCADNDSSLIGSAAYRRLRRVHPDVTTWEGTEFVGESALPGGGERFVFSCPLGGYHAEAGRWNAIFALDFDVAGTFVGHKLLRISEGRAP